MKKNTAGAQSTKPSKEEDVTIQPTSSFVSKFKNEMKKLHQLYSNYQKESSDQTPIPSNELSLFLEWVLHYSEYCEEDLHSGELRIDIARNDKNLYKSSSKDNFMKNYLPGFLTGPWPIRFNSKPKLCLQFKEL